MHAWYMCAYMYDDMEMFIYEYMCDGKTFTTTTTLTYTRSNR